MPDLLAASVIAVWIIVLIEGVFLLGTLRYLGRISARLGPEVPLFQGTTVVERLPVSALSPTAAQYRLLLFVAPGCGVCEPVLSGLKGRLRSDIATTIIARASETEAHAYVGRFGLARSELLADPQGEYATSAGVHETPVAVVTSRDGRRIASAIVNSSSQVETLVDAYTAVPA